MCQLDVTRGRAVFAVGDGDLLGYCYGYVDISFGTRLQYLPLQERHKELLKYTSSKNIFISTTMYISDNMNIFPL